MMPVTLHALGRRCLCSLEKMQRRVRSVFSRRFHSIAVDHADQVYLPKL